MGRIECGGGKDGDPDLRPPGWKSYASCVFLMSVEARCRGMQSSLAVWMTEAYPKAINSVLRGVQPLELFAVAIAPLKDNNSRTMAQTSFAASGVAA